MPDGYVSDFLPRRPEPLPQRIQDLINELIRRAELLYLTSGLSNEDHLSNILFKFAEETANQADIIYDEVHKHMKSAPRRRSKHHSADRLLCLRMNELTSEGYTCRQAAEQLLPQISGGNNIQDKSKIERLVGVFEFWVAMGRPR